MKYQLDEEFSSESMYIPLRSANLDYPVTAYFLDLAKMYMGAVRWHWHDEIEIIIINHGHATIMVEDSQETLSPGQGIMLNQGALHSIRPVNGEPCSFYSLLFHPSLLFGYGQTYFSSRYLTPVLSSPFLKYVTLEESTDWQEELIDHVNNAIAANLTQKFGYELVTKAELCLFWAGILEHCTAENTEDSSVSPEASLDSKRVKEALIYIEHHYMEQIALEDIADSIHVSKSECCRCFKRALHITPIEYVMKYRIFEATRKIKRKDAEAKSMSTLALSVGFNNASYFNKLFKKYLDCTPSEYKDYLKRNPAFREEAGPLQIPSPFQENF